MLPESVLDGAYLPCGSSPAQVVALLMPLCSHCRARHVLSFYLRPIRVAHTLTYRKTQKARLKMLSAAMISGNKSYTRAGSKQ